MQAANVSSPMYWPSCTIRRSSPVEFSGSLGLALSGPSYNQMLWMSTAEMEAAYPPE